MQDRYRQLDEILLLRTAGPYIRVIRVDFAISARMSGYPPLTTKQRTSRIGRFVPQADVLLGAIAAVQVTLVGPG